MRAIGILIIVLLPIISFGQSQENTKWIKRGILSADELTIFAASKYVVPSEPLKYDSSYYYEGDFLILAERFDEGLFNNESYYDIFKIEDEKSIHGKPLNFIDLTGSFGNTGKTRIILLSIPVCSDYFIGLVLEVSPERIVKLFELEMWGEAGIKVEQIDEQFYTFKYRTEDGIKTDRYDSKKKIIVNHKK